MNRNIPLQAILYLIYTFVTTWNRLVRLVVSFAKQRNQHAQHVPINNYVPNCTIAE